MERLSPYYFIACDTSSDYEEDFDDYAYVQEECFGVILEDDEASESEPDELEEA